MPPYSNASHDRPRPSSASQNQHADTSRSSVASTTSYSSLGHALAPDASRSSDSSYHRRTAPNSSRPTSQMASDSRYMYHPQDVHAASPYPYAYPPAPPYENGQYAQTSSRPPVRSPPPPQPVQHPPPPAPYNGAPPTYPSQPGYPPPAYGVPPQPPQQWSSEWSHYNAGYPPPPPPGQHPYAPPANARPDLSPSTPSDDRRYPQPPPRQEPLPRRVEERPPPRPEAAPPPPAPVRKTRDNDPPPLAPAPPPPVAIQATAPPPPAPQAPAPAPAPPHLSTVGIDFLKLVESYRVILDATTAAQYEASAPSRPPPSAETFERMLQAANYGAQVLEAAQKRVVIEPPRPPPDRASEEADSEAARARQQSSENQPATEGQTCLGCSATSTPEWRRGPMGPRTLCNACGLVYAKLIKKRNRNDPGRGRGGQKSQSTGQIVHGLIDDQNSGGESGSEDEDSYGSQPDRSHEMGYRGGRE